MSLLRTTFAATALIALSALLADCAKPVVNSISVAPKTLTLAMGSAAAASATGGFSNGTTRDITTQVVWSSSNTAVATVGGKTGQISAIKSGTASISATGQGITSSCKLTVSAPLGGIAVTPAAKSIPAGTNQTMKATATYADGSTADLSSQVTWTSSDTSVGTFTSFPGQLHSIAAGSITITATDSASGVSGSTTMTVTNATLSTITLSASPTTVAVGLPTQFTATGHYSDASSADITDLVTWSGTNATFATAPKGQATFSSSGSKAVSATLTSVTGNLTFAVASAALSSITVSGPTSTPLGIDATGFVATGHYSDSSSGTLTTGLTWSSTNGAVADFTGTTLVPASVGSTNLSVTHSPSGISSPAFAFTVDPAALISIAVTPAGGTLSLSGTTAQQLTATGTYSDSTTGNITTTVTWTSSAPLVATVSSTGEVNAVLPGSTNIKAENTAAGVSDTVTFTVTP